MTQAVLASNLYNSRRFGTHTAWHGLLETGVRFRNLFLPGEAGRYFFQK